MEGRFAVWLQAALLLAALISAEDQNTPEYCRVGGELVLRPKPVSGRITSISWKFNGGIVGEWVNVTLPLEYSSLFRGRANVDTTTGVLELSDMMKNYSGVYTVEINDRIQSGGYDVKAIEPVPQPEAIVRPLTCSPSSESCFLSCDGDVTEAGPVTYYFKKGDGDWKEETKDITIMNDEDTKAVEKFSCRMKNPLGQKDSKSVNNPFHVGSNAGKNAGIAVAVLLLIAAGVGVAVVLYWKKVIICRKTPDTEKGGTSEGAPLNDVQPPNGGQPEEQPLNVMQSDTGDKQEEEPVDVLQPQTGDKAEEQPVNIMDSDPKEDA